MAIFSDNREQTKQDERIQFRQAKGFNKTKLALMGYNADGTMNKFGAAVNVIDPGLAAAQRIGARQVYGKNSDVGRTMRKTDDEYIAQRVAQVDFAGEVVKTVYGGAAVGGAGAAGAGAAAGGAGAAGAGGGAAGAAAGGGGAAASSMSGGSGATAALGSGGGDMASVLNSGGGAGGGDIAMSSDAVSGMDFSGGGGGAIDPSVADSGMSSSLSESGDIVTSGGDPYADALNGETGQKLSDLQDKSDTEDIKDQLEEQAKKKAKEEMKNKSENEEDVVR